MQILDTSGVAFAPSSDNVVITLGTEGAGSYNPPNPPGVNSYDGCTPVITPGPYGICTCAEWL